jgi:hypothetical protein
MNYYKEVSKSFVKVWEDFYINYPTMFEILKPIYKKYKEQQKKRMEKQIESMNFTDNVDSEPLLNEKEKEINNKNELKESNKIRDRFREQFLLELQKVDFFYNQNINKVIRPKIKEIKEQIKHAIKTNEFKMNNEVFEMAIKETYKDIFLTRKFINTNLDIKNKLMKKYKKYFGMESRYPSRKNESNSNNQIILEDDKENEDDNNNDEIEATINNFILFKSAMGSSEETLTNLEKEITDEFIQNFSYKYKSKTDKVLKKYMQVNTLTDSESFYLGFFIGLLIFQFSIICILAWYYDIDMDHDVEFKSVFPMFRGFFIVCLYWWFHGLNVLIWTEADISYRVIFQIDNNYSTPIEIFKRAAIFTFILLSCLLIYMVKRIWAGAFFGIFEPIPINCLPLICWGSIMAYAFCPFDIWNYDGRVYLGQLTKESFGSFLLKTGFKHVFFMGQICSFIAPLRDIEYTICYYAYYDAPLWAKIEYCKKTRGVYFFIAFIPNFLRILQNIKEIYDSKKFFPKFYSIINYCLSITVALLSFLWPQHPSLHIFWLIFTFISSCCSFAWDIIIDFGFFEKGNNYPLRNKLYYKPKFIYYFILMYNFVLRFFWLLTISPEVLGTLFRPETLSIILNSFEITRRSCWNILKVENKHIDISKEYKVSNDIELPFVKVNGKYVNNESNLLNIMKMNRQEKIQVEIEKVLQENRSNSRAKYMSRNLTDLKEVKGIMNNELNEYLEVYRRDTGVNMGLISKKLNQPTRRWATNY